MRIHIVTVLLSGCLLIGGSRVSAAVFSDDFAAGASGQWVPVPADQWQASGGAYVGTPTVANAHSLLPYEMSDLSFEVDLNNIGDGGVWLRSHPVQDGIGLEGVLFVVRSGDAYWHTATGGGWGPLSGYISYSGATHLRLTVEGTLYSAYLDGAAVADTTLDTNLFSSGQVGLYSNNGSQSFDNVVLDGTIVPEPASLSLLIFAGATLVARRHRR